MSWPRLWVVVPVAGVLLAAYALWPGTATHSEPNFPAAPTVRPTLKVTPEQRVDALRRARVWRSPEKRRRTALASTADRDGAVSTSPVECRYVPEPPHGTTTKFECILANGEAIKVKYGLTREKQAETAASRLLTYLGFLADDMFLVPDVRCYECPRRPFEIAWTADRLHADWGSLSWRHRYVDFMNVAVERRADQPSIETDDTEGWAWYELDAATPRDPDRRVERDALKLAALLVAHWDNKAENQRLVCGDVRQDGHACQEPWAMIHDLGATFGPNKVDLAAWRRSPIWSDPQACTVSMRQLPYDGGTFKDSRISEGGRQLLLRELQGIAAGDAEALFAGAGFDAPSAWAAVLLDKVRQIADAGPCPDEGSAPVSPVSYRP